MVFVVGTIGYLIIGMSPIDAMYMTLTTITTVGYEEFTGPNVGVGVRIFTMFVILTGVGTAFYAFTLVVQVIVEGQLREVLGQRRMDKKISKMTDHVIVCGWGRVGKAVANDMISNGIPVVVVEEDGDKMTDPEIPAVIGDARIDATLIAAGVERASSLIAALDADADNLFITMSSRALKPDLFIVARTRSESGFDMLIRAGANRVVNPQELGAARMASFVMQPNVAEFIDVVMHERSMDFRMQEVKVGAGSSLDGVTLREADLRRRTGILVLALRGTSGKFATNPDPDTHLNAGSVIIAVGTPAAIDQLVAIAR